MYGIISALKQSELFSAVDIIELIDEESVRLIKAKAKVLGVESRVLCKFF